MWEQSKASLRRYSDGAFHSRYFVGDGLDIGGAPDPLGQYAGVFARMNICDTWDKQQGDANYLREVERTYDFVHSSHCLEHMIDPYVALENWLRVINPGGFLIVTVPDEDLYEMGTWPSRFNYDHKWTFTIHKSNSWSPRSINITDLIRHFQDSIVVERVTLLRDFFRPEIDKKVNQTRTLVAECAIEFVWQKNGQ